MIELANTLLLSEQISEQITEQPMDLQRVLGLYNYWVVIFLMMTGFYIVIARSNLVKTVIGLNIFQTSVFLLYITMGKVKNGTAPILSAAESKAMSHGGHGDGHVEHHGAEHAAHGSATDHGIAYDTAHEVAHESGVEAGLEAVEATQRVFTNPLPSVFMLTAIVVGIATTALALALIVRIREDYGTIEEDEIMEIDLRS